jgi:hypothetical protein
MFSKKEWKRIQQLKYIVVLTKWNTETGVWKVKDIERVYPPVAYKVTYDMRRAYVTEKAFVAVEVTDAN